MACRIDQPTRAEAVDDPIAGPQIAVQAGWWLGRTADDIQPRSDCSEDR